MSLRRLRRNCEERLADLPVPSPFSVPALVRNMEAVSGRRIILMPLPDHMQHPDTACGLRVKTPRWSLVLFKRRATENQTNHTILHELGHEWFDHGGTLTPEDLHRQIPTLGPRLIARFTGGVAIQARAHYDTVEEREAEVSASLIPLMARDQPVRDDVLGRLDSSLSRPVASRRRRRP
ncbi:toxin [Streptomyces sp. WAC 00631]|uniref:toxin n=1 Tax=Streptomyces TaxID=1883 RepID=UPI000F7AEE93|nr:MULTISPECIES: toxin [Streptomyces]MCC5033571.1 toxin [Streptomyces sp. WAC 00631]WSQ70037.1 toxin [Streptomyces xinghaiensis]